MPHNYSPTGTDDVSFVPTCPACGKENFAFARFCITCGEPLDDLPRGDLPEEQPHSHTTTEAQHPTGPPRSPSPDARRLLRWEQAVGVVLLLCTLGYVLFNW